MTLQDIVRYLPTEPPRELWDWAETMVDIGEDYLLFHRDTVYVPDPKEAASPEDILCGPVRTVPRHGAVCTCTLCGETFETGWASNPRARMKGIRISLQENGWWPGYVAPDDEYAINIPEGETLNCPYCECGVQLIHKASIENGRTFQIMLGNVGSIGPYAVIYTWLYRRVIYGATNLTDIRPARAYVVTEKGNLHQYNHVKQNSYGGTYDLPCWERARTVGDDPFLTLYYNYDAVNHKQVGGLMWDQVPSLDGTTAEKTGLEEYLLSGGGFPVAYMQEWRRHPYIENLLKAGFSGQVAEDIDGQINGHLNYGNRSGRVRIEWADLSKARPGHQLGMTKQEMSELSAVWNVGMLENWARYRGYSARISATEYENHRRAIGVEALDKLTAYAAGEDDEGWLDKAARYIARQKDPTRSAEMLCDLWDMLDEREEAGETITAWERWPRNLEETHDRESNRRAAIRDKKIDLAFARVAEKYAALEWTDGQLCVRLPRSNHELVQEGNVLRHCVGSYGSRHTQEKVIVFFVRHYRRPERSYYTMDYTLGDNGAYRRNQLHGYGNERHGKHKEHSHRIPPKVLAFVAQWERDVLKPWLCQQITVAKQPKQKKRSA